MIPDVSILEKLGVGQFYAIIIIMLIPSILLFINNKKKISTDNDRGMVDDAVKLYKEIQNENRVIKAEMDSLRDDYEEMRAGVLVLVEQLKRCNIKPEWTPPRRRIKKAATQ